MNLGHEIFIDNSGGILVPIYFSYTLIYVVFLLSFTKCEMLKLLKSVGFIGLITIEVSEPCDALT